MECQDGYGGKPRADSGKVDVYSWCMSETVTITKPATSTTPRVEQPRFWNVVLLDDQDHSYEYVIEMMQKLFGHPLERSFMIAKHVDADGRAICMTTHREHAELKVEQVHGFGRDIRISSCKGSMTAILEPADLGGDDSDQH